jgi:ribosomal protein S18 acetylase RimI-like enzyme
MDVCENEADIILTASSNISIGNMLSFEDPFGETSMVVKNDLFRQFEINTEVDIYFTTNKLYFTSMKKHFIIFKIKYPQSFFDKVFNGEYKVLYGVERSSNILTCFSVINIIDKNAEILAMGVIKEYQNRKVGSKLLKKVCEELTGSGVITVRLIVQCTNDVAIALYKKFEFIVEKNIKGYYRDLKSDNSNAYLMKKELVKKKFLIFKVFKRITDKIFYLLAKKV